MIQNQSDFLREHEIEEVLKLLNSKSLVVVLGEEGRGKTTFLKEAYEFTQLKNIPSVWFDCHNIYRNLTHDRTVKSVQASYLYIVEWAKNLPSNKPQPEQPILFIDAGDWLFLTHGFVTAPLPFYKSKEWESWMKIKKNSPKKWVEYIFMTYLNNVLNLKITEQLISSYEADVETYFAQEAVLQVIEDLVRQKKGKVIITDHNLPREHITGSPFLLKKYESIVKLGQDYDLPPSYEPEKARLFLERNYQIIDKVLQDEIIAQTQGKHIFLKLALDPETIEKLKKTPDSQEREKILKEAVEKITVTKIS